MPTIGAPPRESLDEKSDMAVDREPEPVVVSPPRQCRRSSSLLDFPVNSATETVDASCGSKRAISLQGIHTKGIQGDGVEVPRLASPLNFSMICVHGACDGKGTSLGAAREKGNDATEEDKCAALHPNMSSDIPNSPLRQFFRPEAMIPRLSPSALVAIGENDRPRSSRRASHRRSLSRADERVDIEGGNDDGRKRRHRKRPWSAESTVDDGITQPLDGQMLRTQPCPPFFLDGSRVGHEVEGQSPQSCTRIDSDDELESIRPINMHGPWKGDGNRTGAERVLLVRGPKDRQRCRTISSGLRSLGLMWGRRAPAGNSCIRRSQDLSRCVTVDSAQPVHTACPLRTLDPACREAASSFTREFENRERVRVNLNVTTTSTGSEGKNLRYGDGEMGMLSSVDIQAEASRSGRSESLFSPQARQPHQKRQKPQHEQGHDECAGQALEGAGVFGPTAEALSRSGVSLDASGSVKIAQKVTPTKRCNSHLLTSE